MYTRNHLKGVDNSVLMWLVIPQVPFIFATFYMRTLVECMDRHGLKWRHVLGISLTARVRIHVLTIIGAILSLNLLATLTFFVS